MIVRNYQLNSSVGYNHNEPDEERVGLVQGLHESGQRVLELRRDGKRLFPFASGSGRPTGQSLHALQVLQALLRTFPGPERLVLPVKVCESQNTVGVTPNTGHRRKIAA